MKKKLFLKLRSQDFLHQRLKMLHRMVLDVPPGLHQSRGTSDHQPYTAYDSRQQEEKTRKKAEEEEGGKTEQRPSAERRRLRF